MKDRRTLELPTGNGDGPVRIPVWLIVWGLRSGLAIALIVLTTSISWAVWATDKIYSLMGMAGDVAEIKADLARLITKLLGE